MSWLHARKTLRVMGRLAFVELRHKIEQITSSRRKSTAGVVGFAPSANTNARSRMVVLVSVMARKSGQEAEEVCFDLLPSRRTSHAARAIAHVTQQAVCNFPLSTSESRVPYRRYQIQPETIVRPAIGSARADLPAAASQLYSDDRPQMGVSGVRDQQDQRLRNAQL